MYAEHFFITCAAITGVLSLALLARRSYHAAGVVSIGLILLTMTAWFLQSSVAPVTLWRLLETRGNPFFWIVTGSPMVLAILVLERVRRKTAPKPDEAENELWYVLLVPLLEVVIGAVLMPVIVAPLVGWLAPSVLGLPEWVGEERGRVTLFIAGMVVNFGIVLMTLVFRGPVQTLLIAYVTITCFVLVFNFGMPVAVMITVVAHIGAKSFSERPAETQATAAS